MKRWIELITLLIAWVSVLFMTFFFALFWVQCSVWIGEDNLVIRAIETIVLLFGFIAFSVYILKYIWMHKHEL